MKRITPFLWFDGQAEQAANFYVSLFPDSRITATTRYGDAGPGPKGQVMTIAFEIGGQPFTALNGGPQFKFNESISFVVQCENQAEIDKYWSKLIEGGGKPSQCGWLKDRWGLSWQIVPEVLPKLLQDKDAEKAQRVMHAMLQMTKIEIAGLEGAYAQR